MSKTLKSSISFLLALALIFSVTFAFTTEIQASETSIPNMDIQPVSSEVQANGVETLTIPGDFTNLCTIKKTTKQDNVTLANYEQKIIAFIIGGGVGSLAAKVVKGTLRNFVVGGLGTAFLTIPTRDYLYTTTMHRECKDSTGFNQYLIIEYYSDSARTKQLYVDYLKIGI